MKLLNVRALIFFWILALAVMSHAASDEDVRINWDKDSGGDGASNPFRNGSQAPTGNVSDDTMLRLLENRRDQKNQQDPAGEPRDEIISTDKGKNDSRTSNAKKPQVLVKVEPGDGLVKLTWKLANVPEKSDNQTMRFSIRYGLESEKLTKIQHVGTRDGHVLRELKNNQPYYIQIVATDREQLLLYKSDEIRIVPLPTEDQGSRLEKAFSMRSA